MARTSERVLNLLEDLTFDNPPPEEQWYAEDDFDPRQYRTAIRAAERTGCIEVDRADPELWRFRLTAKGRSKAPTTAAEEN